MSLLSIVYGIQTPHTGVERAKLSFTEAFVVERRKE